MREQVHKNFTDFHMLISQNFDKFKETPCTPSKSQLIPTKQDPRTKEKMSTLLIAHLSKFRLFGIVSPRGPDDL